MSALGHASFSPRSSGGCPRSRGLRDVEGWAGLYEMTPDHNPVLGEHPALGGFIFANGFSGHGLMMSPATGKIVSEFVRLGRSDDVRRRASSRPIDSSAARWCTTPRPSDSSSAFVITCLLGHTSTPDLRHLRHLETYRIRLTATKFDAGLSRSSGFALTITTVAGVGKTPRRAQAFRRTRARPHRRRRQVGR